MPEHLTNQEFARRVYRLMIERGWRQSELARQAGLSRDCVSTYTRGKSLPTSQNLEKLAAALGVNAEDLLPNYRKRALDNDLVGFSMQESSAHPGKAWVRVNRLVAFSTATRIAQLLEAEKDTA